MENKMKKGSTPLIFLFTLICALIPKPALADYIADQFVTISQGEIGANPRIFSAKIYSQKKKLRMEVVIAGRRSINISRGDKKEPVFWNLMPDEKMYTESQGGPSGPGGVSPDAKQDYEKVFLAKEPVAGIMTNKFKLSWKEDDGSRRSGLVWEAIEFDNAPIRQEFFSNNQHLLLQLANIKVQKLDPKLFEVPSGYKKISMPVDMPAK